MKALKIIGKISLWVLFAFLAIMTIGSAGLGSIAAVPFAVSAVLVMPIKPVDKLWSIILREKEDTVEPVRSTAPLPEKKKRKRRYTVRPAAIAVLILVALIMLGVTNEGESDGVSTETTVTTAVTESTVTETTAAAETAAPSETTATTAVTTTSVTTTAVTTTSATTSEPTPPPAFDPSLVPAFSGKPYTEVNGSVPFFDKSEIVPEPFERYSPLDSLGRCGTAYACVGIELMPTDERGSIGMIKPTGWHTVKYDNVEGKYLYNRCHLIGYQLTGENANVQNLITGTRYMNMTGMLPFENLVEDYVRETGNHVLYRTTPVFGGDNLVADGVLMEGLSVEDGGDGVRFCVFCYNVQPGITIDYATGESTADVPVATTTAETTTASSAVPDRGIPVTPDVETPSECSYVVNKNTKKFHYPTCSSVKSMAQKNRWDVTATRDYIISLGYEPCKNCNP